MKLYIKYIPDIFPNVDFYQYRELQNFRLIREKSEVENQSTERKWSLSYDKFNIHRIKQSVITERYSLSFVSYENSDFPLISQTDFSYIITDDNKRLNIYDVSTDYTDENGIFQIKMYFSVKNLQNATFPLTSDNVFNYCNSNNLPLNKIDFTAYKPYIYAGKTSFWFSTAIASVTIFLENQYPISSFTTGDKLYIYFRKGYTQASIDFMKWLQNDYIKVYDYYYVTNRLRFDYTAQQVAAEELIFDIIISYEPITVNIDKDLPVTSFDFSIYTAFNPKFKFLQKFDGELVTNEKLSFPDNVTFERIIEVPFFLKKSELYLLEFLAQSRIITFKHYTSISEYTEYEAIQTTDLYKEIENDNLIDVYEFMLTLKYLHVNQNLLKD